MSCESSATNKAELELPSSHRIATPAALVAVAVQHMILLRRCSWEGPLGLHKTGHKSKEGSIYMLHHLEVSKLGSDVVVMEITITQEAYDLLSVHKSVYCFEECEGVKILS